ncbi:MAG: Mov34/MPN/PAD-1 family protein [Bryobacterales bacterium]|nr:Mov34/MPN/PAD-1 family protein [Bryobacterales bacterium]
MPAEYLPAPGEVVSANDLTIPKARQTALFLLSCVHPYARFLAARRNGENEVVVVDLSIEVGQEPVHDIRPAERVAIEFTPTDSFPPEVLALRGDFPLVPHTNLRAREFPRSLCLYEESYDEVKLRWTAPAFIERIRIWMRDTGTGTLHRDDQPLEPILLTWSHLVIPSDLFTGGQQNESEQLIITNYIHDEKRGEVLVAERPAAGKPGIPFVVTALRCPPQPHGVIRHQPSNLAALHDLVAITGIDLLAELFQRLANWDRAAAPLTSRLVLIVYFPKMRCADAPPEASDIWAFLTLETVETVGSRLGVWEVRDGKVGQLIGATVDRSRVANIAISSLNPTFALSRASAAALSGFAPDERRITAIGVGALGSQVIPILVREGFGEWTVVDDDRLLPHNLVRHGLTKRAVGYAKAIAVHVMGNELLEQPAMRSSVVANVLRPGDSASLLKTALDDSAVIADFSASVAVGRHLARDVNAPARRVSLFLNPTGTDLVMLAEDVARQIPLDCLEMQYYRELVANPDMADHLRPAGGRVRYAQSCRDLTSTVPGELVALHAAIGASALRRSLAGESSGIQIWKAGADGSVRAFPISARPIVKEVLSEWTLYTDDGLMDKLRALRHAKLPRETGGVLLGSFDMQRRIVYVVDTIASPPDSQEWPTVYVRGCKGLHKDIAVAEERTQRMLHYVGEWHSHPDGYSALPSNDDLLAFDWLTRHLETDGVPALMIIATEANTAFFLGRMHRG